MSNSLFVKSDGLLSFKRGTLQEKPSEEEPTYKPPITLQEEIEEEPIQEKEDEELTLETKKSFKDIIQLSLDTNSIPYSQDEPHHEDQEECYRIDENIYYDRGSKVVNEMNHSLRDIIEMNEEPEIKNGKGKINNTMNNSMNDIVEAYDDESSPSFNNSLNLSISNSINQSLNPGDDVTLFEDDDRIYISKMDIESVPQDIVEDVNSFVSELIFLSDVGKKHMFNFLIDISENRERLDRNKKMLGKLCYREYFVLWLSPSVAQKMLSENNHMYKFLLRTSTTLAGYYTFTFRKKDNIVNHLRVRGSELGTKLREFKKKFRSLNVNPIYMKTNGYHVGYVPRNEEIMKPISLSHNTRRNKKDDI